MIYALLKTLHLLCVILWVGGMVFAHFFLRPALAELDALMSSAQGLANVSPEFNPVRPQVYADILREMMAAATPAMRDQVKAGRAPGFILLDQFIGAWRLLNC